MNDSHTAGILVMASLSLTVTCFIFTIITGALVWIRANEDPISGYHGRYVLPPLDFDQEASSVWARVMTASSSIKTSEVVNHRLIDSIHVFTVLPYHLWAIAKAMAKLSQVRGWHQQILSGVDSEHPDLADVLQPQLSAQAAIATNVEQHVCSLEAFAALTQQADAAWLRERAASQLAQLNDAHIDLLAEQDNASNRIDAAGYLSRDLNVVIDRAHEAIKRANEAGRNLALPGFIRYN